MSRQTKLDGPISVTYLDIRSRQLEGTYPGDPMSGVWPVSAARISRGWGAVKESDWPYVSSAIEWPPREPPGLDTKAKQFRCHHYQRIRSARGCCQMLGHLTPVSAAFEITEQWHKAEHGLIQLPKPSDSIIGSHCICIVGFDLQLGLFRFINSWGEEWGENGFGYLSFEYFEKFLVDSWVNHGRGYFPDYYDFTGKDLVAWGVPDFLGHSFTGGDVIHGREIYDATNDERLGWAFAVHRGQYLDIEEIFVRPEHRRIGIAGDLARELLRLRDEAKRPLRLWISWGDWEPANQPAVEKIANRLGLELKPSEVRWAAMVATESRNSAETTAAAQAYRPSRPGRLKPQMTLDQVQLMNDQA